MNSKLHGILHGINSSNQLMMKVHSNIKTVSINELVQTSGYVDGFPENLHIGTIESIDKINKKIFIKPFVKFDNLNYVTIINSIPYIINNEK